MIKLAGEMDGQPAVGIGLSFENLRRLKEGQPIHINLLEMNLPYNVTLLIFAGETEQSMTNLLKDAGILRSETPIHTFTEQ